MFFPPQLKTGLLYEACWVSMLWCFECKSPGLSTVRILLGGTPLGFPPPGRGSCERSDMAEGHWARQTMRSNAPTAFSLLMASGKGQTSKLQSQCLQRGPTPPFTWSVTGTKTPQLSSCPLPTGRRRRKSGGGGVKQDLGKNSRVRLVKASLQTS